MFGFDTVDHAWDFINVVAKSAGFFGTTIAPKTPLTKSVMFAGIPTRH